MFGTTFTQRKNKKKDFSAWKGKIYKNMNTEAISRKTAEPFPLDRSLETQKFQSNENK